MKNLTRYIKRLGAFVLLAGAMASCKQDEYFDDGGRAKAQFSGTILEYLQSKPTLDTVAQIIKLAGMDSIFNKEEITFFAPTDEVIRRTIGSLTAGGLNKELFTLGKDTVKTLSDIDPAIWRKYLLRYVLKGRYQLKDFPQIDYDLKQLFPGAFYYTYTKDVVNVGVVYNSANNVKYIGYRQLSYCFLPDASNPTNFVAAAVATSDIQPQNGLLHVLALSIGDRIGSTLTNPGANLFGFNGDFNREVILNK